MRRVFNQHKVIWLNIMSTMLKKPIFLRTKTCDFRRHTAYNSYSITNHSSSQEESNMDLVFKTYVQLISLG